MPQLTLEENLEENLSRLEEASLSSKYEACTAEKKGENIQKKAERRGKLGARDALCLLYVYAFFPTVASGVSLMQTDTCNMNRQGENGPKAIWLNTKGGFNFFIYENTGLRKRHRIKFETSLRMNFHPCCKALGLCGRGMRLGALGKRLYKSLAICEAGCGDSVRISCAKTFSPYGIRSAYVSISVFRNILSTAEW